MEPAIARIANLTLLQSIPSEEIQAYLKDGRFKTVSYQKNSVVHFDGEVCNKLEIIISGRIDVERIDQSGNLLTIAQFYSDDILGGNLMFSKHPYYPMTITAYRPSVILEISMELLFLLFCKNPLFLRAYLGFVSDRTFLLGDKIKHYVHRTIRECLISFLKQESVKQNSKHIRLNCTKKMLAEKIGVQRTSLSRELKRMKDEGLILLQGDCITVLRSDILL